MNWSLYQVSKRYASIFFYQSQNFWVYLVCIRKAIIFHWLNYNFNFICWWYEKGGRTIYCFKVESGSKLGVRKRFPISTFHLIDYYLYFVCILFRWIYVLINYRQRRFHDIVETLYEIIIGSTFRSDYLISVEMPIIFIRNFIIGGSFIQFTCDQFHQVTDRWE